MVSHKMIVSGFWPFTHGKCTESSGFWPFTHGKCTES